MKKPFAISLGFHAAILLAALVALPTPNAFKVNPPEVIQVDIGTVISDKTRKTAQTKEPAPPKPQQANNETKVTRDIPPAPKVADKVNTAAREPTPPPPSPPTPPQPPPPKPEPPPPKPQPDTKALDQLLKDDAAKQQQADAAAVAEAQKQADEKKRADAQKLAEEKKKAEALKQAAEKKRAEDKKKLAVALADAQAQLNKIAGEAAAPAPPSEIKGAPKQTEKNQQGADNMDTATLAAALISRIKECFNIPPAAREVNVSVPIHFTLNPDGSLSAQPEVQGSSSEPVFQATARAAISAIAQCAPYQLPAAQYDQWKDNVIDFNPTRLTG